MKQDSNAPLYVAIVVILFVLVVIAGTCPHLLEL